MPFTERLGGLPSWPLCSILLYVYNRVYTTYTRIGANMEMRAESVEELNEQLIERSKGQAESPATSRRDATLTLRIRESEKWALEQLAEIYGLSRSGMGYAVLTSAIWSVLHNTIYNHPDSESRERAKEVARKMGIGVDD